MMDMADRYEEASGESNRKAKAKKAKDMILKAITMLGPLHAGVPLLYVSKLIKDSRGSVSDLFDITEEHITSGPLTAVEVYTSIGVQISDFYTDVRKSNRLWQHLTKRGMRGIYLEKPCNILFKPKGSPTIWMLTNTSVPIHPCIPHIVVPNRSAEFRNFIVLRLDSFLDPDELDNVQ